MAALAIQVAGAPPHQILQGTAAPKQIPQGSSLVVHPLFREGPDILQRILAFADSARAALTCRDFLKATNTLLQREWSRFDLKSYPYINSVFLGRAPTNLGELGAIVGEMQGKCHIQTLSPRYAGEALKAMKAPFFPLSFKTLEDAARQAESDRNLCIIWKRIAGALNIPANSLSPAEIKEWLRTHADELAQIETLELSKLNLTMIPEEFATLDLPNLTTLKLSNNLLRTLPNKFGARWSQLQDLELDHNQLTVLPNDFGSSWSQLGGLYLDHNQLSSLPDNFGNHWFGLESLRLCFNLLSALPDNFGTSWHQLNMLNLCNNRLRILPANFGENWNRLEDLQLVYNQLRILPANFGASWLDLWNLSLNYNQLKTLPNNFGENWHRLGLLYLNNNLLSALPENLGTHWIQLTHLYLNDNKLSALRDNFGNNWNQLRSLSLYNNRLRVLPNQFGANWAWWNQMREVVLLNNPILNPAPVTVETPEEPSLNVDLNAAAIHIFSTAVLSVFASYIVSSNIPLALGAVYLGHHYTRDVLWE
jgi:Leucine-rich repeat (LRR) protein